MRLAIKEAEISKRKGNWPGGAVLVRSGKIIAKAQNSVVSSPDVTAHAEIEVIRKACRKLKTWDLKEAELYSPAESCPMCMSAVVWANLKSVYFGVSLKDLMKLGDSQIRISSAEVVEKSFRKVLVNGGILKDICLQVYK